MVNGWPHPHETIPTFEPQEVKKQQAGEGPDPDRTPRKQTAPRPQEPRPQGGER